MTTSVGHTCFQNTALLRSESTIDGSTSSIWPEPKSSSCYGHMDPRNGGAQHADKVLHISAYLCDKCDDPVIAGLLGTRDTEISKRERFDPGGDASYRARRNKSKRSMATSFVSLLRWNGSREKRTKRTHGRGFEVLSRAAPR